MIASFILLIMSLRNRTEERRGRQITFMRDKCERAITCVSCHDLHFILLCYGLLQNDLFIKGAVSPKRIARRFWETAYLPLPIYFLLRAKCWLRGGVGE